MSDLLDQVNQRVRVRRLFESGQGILVGVSGGVDSMVLLHILHQLTGGQQWRLTVAHFNHGLRGRSSDADELPTYGVLGVPDVNNKPGGRYGSAGTSDTAGNAWFFGGFGEDSTGTRGYQNDVWQLQ